jgi:hypothetical protein
LGTRLFIYWLPLPDIFVHAAVGTHASHLEHAYAAQLAQVGRAHARGRPQRARPLRARLLRLGLLGVQRLREGHPLPAPLDGWRSPTYAWDFAALSDDKSSFVLGHSAADTLTGHRLMRNQLREILSGVDPARAVRI